MGESEIFSISLMAPTGAARTLYSDLGLLLGQTPEQGRAEVRKIFEGDIEKWGKGALNFYKSAVPVRNYQLRNFILARSANRVLKKVVVLDSLHTSSNTKEPITSDLLADILEEGKHRTGPRRIASGNPYKRSKNARAVADFEVGGTSKDELTAGWADEAFNSFDRWMD